LKLYYLIFISILYISCKDDISNRKYRNQNYVFYEEEGKEGEWLKIDPNLEIDLPKSHSSYFFPNGNRYAELEVIDSFPNRIIHYFDIKDNLTKVVKFNLDTVTEVKYEEGFLEFYHSSLGIKSKDGTVKNGLEQGLWKRYNEDGVLIKEFHLKNGLDHGNRTDYYANGNIESISNWENDLQIGLAKYYYENGNIHEINSVLNKNLHGESIEYYESGQVETHEFFWNGNRKDTGTNYYENGQVKIIQIYNLDTISLNSSGTQTNYFLNGNLQAKATFNGKYANMTLYYENGKTIKQVAEKYNNKHHGKAIAYHENGYKRLEGDFKENLYHGPFKFYSTSGNLIKTVNYYYNEPIDSIMH
jgi:antitoxin component YwqK of YwqJK toxin-antitoxin module